MQLITKLIWNEIFETGIIPKGITEANLCGIGIAGWATCMMSKDSPIPEKFGEGMVAIGQRLGISPTVENLESLAIEKGWLKK